MNGWEFWFTSLSWVVRECLRDVWGTLACPEVPPDCRQSHVKTILRFPPPRCSPGEPRSAPDFSQSHFGTISLGQPGEPRSAPDCSKSHFRMTLRIHYGFRLPRSAWWAQKCPKLQPDLCWDDRRAQESVARAILGWSYGFMTVSASLRPPSPGVPFGTTLRIHYGFRRPRSAEPRNAPDRSQSYFGTTLQIHYGFHLPRCTEPRSAPDWRRNHFGMTLRIQYGCRLPRSA